MILNSPYISGSLTVTGNITAQGGIVISGSIASSSFATTASNALTLQGSESSSFAPASTFNTVSQSYAVASGSLSTRVTTNENNITTLTAASASFAVASGSMSSRVTLIEGQYATTGSNNFTKPQQISDVSNAISFTSTASLYTAGGLRVSKDSFVSGTAYFNNIVVYGTSSIQYITSSQLDISDNIISVNTFTPAVRFGGLAVYDSGSTALTGSLLWDSENNRWVYSNPSGSTYDGGMLISGPRNTTGLGNEVGTTSCALMMGQGGDHITSSAIFSYGNATCFYGQSYISSSGLACFAGTMTVSSIIADGASNEGSIRIERDTVGTSTSIGSLIFTNNNGVTTYGKVFGGRNAAGDGYVALGTGVSCNLYALESGNVGIGTSTPQAPLHVAASNTAQIARFSAPNGYCGMILLGRPDVTTEGLQFCYNSGNGDSTVNSIVGNILLQTYGCTRLTIAPTGAATFACSITAAGAIYAGATSRIGFGTSGAERGAIILDGSYNWTINTNGVAGAMYIASATGNVGIGYTAPDFPLAVFGTNISQGDATITSHFVDKSGYAAGVGGGISFGGYFSPSSYANSFAYVQGIKENGTSGDYAGALKFGTRVNGGSVTERMRITSAGIAVFTCQVCATQFIGTSVNLTGNYNNSYTICSSGWSNQYVTIIPPNTLGTRNTYVVSVYADNNGAGAPYVAGASFLFTPGNTNGSGIDNEFQPLTSMHQGYGGGYSLWVAARAGSGQVSAGLAIKLCNWATVTGGLTVKASLLQPV